MSTRVILIGNSPNSIRDLKYTLRDKFDPSWAGLVISILCFAQNVLLGTVDDLDRQLRSYV